MQVPRDEIIFYHRVRNEIYHGDSEMVPAEKAYPRHKGRSVVGIQHFI
jgi:hypothetical protein